jgi:hypothetical protein
MQMWRMQRVAYSLDMVVLGLGAPRRPALQVLTGYADDCTLYLIEYITFYTCYNIAAKLLQYEPPLLLQSWEISLAIPRHIEMGRWSAHHCRSVTFL